MQIWGRQVRRLTNHPVVFVQGVGIIKEVGERGVRFYEQEVDIQKQINHVAFDVGENGTVNGPGSIVVVEAALAINSPAL